MTVRRAIRSGLTAAVVGAWAVLLCPTFVGGSTTYTIVTGTSMIPTLREGDLAILRTKETYDRGDVVAFRVPDGQPSAGAVIIHRVVAGSGATGFVTEGDNKDSTDPWRPRTEDVLGELWVRVPGAGQTFRWLREPLPMAATAGVIAFVLAISVAPERRPAYVGRHVRRRTRDGETGRNVGLAPVGDGWAFPRAPGAPDA